MKILALTYIIVFVVVTTTYLHIAGCRLLPHAVPEIRRTPLHEMVLSIKLLRLGEAQGFLSKALEPPPEESVTEALVLLSEMAALDVQDQLTPLGTILARLPIEPRMGRMIVLGCIFGLG